MKKIYSAAAAAVLSAAVLMPLFAAGGGDDFDAAGVQLNFLEVLTSPGRTKLIEELIAEYEAQNPDVSINLISPPYEQADNRLTLALNAEERLDIAEVRDYTIKQFVNNDRLTSLEPFLAEWPESETLLSITLQAARTVDQTAYIIPQFFFIKALFVRTDVLADLGVSRYPETIDELIDMSIAITDKDSGQYGFGFRGKGGEHKFSDYITISNVPDVSPQDIYRTESGGFSFAAPAAREYLERYVQLYREAVPSDGINWGFNEQVNAFVSGTAPLLIQDPDTIGVLEGKLEADQYTVIPLPVGRDGLAYLDYGFASLGVPGYSEYKEEATDFLAFMLSARTNERFARGYGALPIHAAAYESGGYFSTGVYAAWREMLDDNPAYRFVSYPLASEKWPGWDQAHTQTMQALLLGQMTPEDVIDRWAEYWSD